MIANKSQVDQFHVEVVELIKKFQFRDRNEMVCCGLSVSQCYILETLHRFGTMSVQKLADKMHLTISTITRVSEPLVKQKLISREEDPTDHRIRLLKLTAKGERIFAKSWKNTFISEKMILENFPEEQRELLIDFLKKLNQALWIWKESCCKK